MHRVVVDLAWTVAAVYIAALVLREVSILAKDSAPSVTRAIEFAIGTGGHGAGTAG